MEEILFRNVSKLLVHYTTHFSEDGSLRNNIKSREVCYK